jgi:propionyl-CoA carboxylase alpha chain
VGVETTLDFCKFVLKHEAFISGKFDTGFIGKYFTPGVLDAASADDELAAIAGALIFGQASNAQEAPVSGVKKSKWRESRLR